MAGETGTVWAVDIGNSSLKALYLSTERGFVEVIGFDNIRHGKILSGSNVTEAEREELIALSLRQFVNKYDLSMDEIAISVPSQNSFARFVNLPPVEEKRIPEMVKFEAVQQIPFGINDVQWDWQLMTEPDSPEIKVGIFAIKNEVVNSVLEHFNREDVQVSYVQMAPMALYNYLLNDRPELVTSDSQATVVLNIGAENTDLVVCTKSAVWQRCILIGGNAFTKAIADTFRLNFEKAEKLKRTAPVSKYARQILQAMKPAFSDLASEIQRSIGFYTSSNSNVKLKTVIALGGGTKLQGLLKYLQQSLQLPIERPDTFKRLQLSEDISSAKFHENIFDFGVVYGLALQGLGYAKINSNLLPKRIEKAMAWKIKARYFLAASILLLLVAIAALARTYTDSMKYNAQNPVRRQITQITSQAQSAINKLNQETRKSAQYNQQIENQFKLFENRQVVPELYETILDALPSEEDFEDTLQKTVHQAFAAGNIDELTRVPRHQRKQLFVTAVAASYAESLEEAEFEEDPFEDLSRPQDIVMDFDFGPMFPQEQQQQSTAKYSRKTYTQRQPQQGQGTADGPGFLITIAGYSPYADTAELIDPVGTGDDRSKWGFITRLLNADPNGPFKLFKKTEVKHFDLQVKPVIIDNDEMPPGIGVRKTIENTQAASSRSRTRITSEEVLVDPMTGEIISQVPAQDTNGNIIKDRSGRTIYQTNDNWFQLKIKMLWNNPQQVTGQRTAQRSY